MKRFHHPFFALLLSLLLLGSQQAAFAHLLSHAQGGAAAVAQYQDDHGALDGAAETCTACIAFAGNGNGAPPATAALRFASLAGDSHPPPAATPVFARPAITSRARAPPAFL